MSSVERDMEKISRLRELVIMIDSTIYNVGKHKSRIIKGIKCALSAMDICNDYVALPLRKFKDDERRAIAQHVSDLGKAIS